MPVISLLFIIETLYFFCGKISFYYLNLVPFFLALYTDNFLTIIDFPFILLSRDTNVFVMGVMAMTDKVI
jgi:hypothetical protein